MKQIYYYAAALTLAAGMTACGSSDSSNAASTENTAENAESGATTFELVSDAGNNPAGVEGLVSFDGARGQLELDGHLLTLKVYPKVVGQTDLVVDHRDGKVVLFDENGNQLMSLSQNVSSDFDKALNKGDVYFDGCVYYIGSCDTDAKAKEIAQKAKTFVVVMTLVDPSELVTEDEPEVSTNLNDLDALNVVDDLEGSFKEAVDNEFDELTNQIPMPDFN